MTIPEWTSDAPFPSAKSENLSAVYAEQQKKLLNLKLIQSFLIAVLLIIGVVIFSFSQNQTYVFYGIISICVTFLLFLVNRQLIQDGEKTASQYEINQKAEIYTYLLNNKYPQINNFTPVKAKALQYCQALIDDYKGVRNSSRTIYYILQITTVVFSGITPILVLVDKIESGQTWLKWLPVICPAIASILASIVTSFPFQKNWVAANEVVELLEAEIEKFILGVTPPYQIYDAGDEMQQQQKASQALEHFIKHVNSIHLKQVQQNNDNQPERKETAPAQESQPQQQTT